MPVSTDPTVQVPCGPRQSIGLPTEPGSRLSQGVAHKQAGSSVALFVYVEYILNGNHVY